MNPQLNNAPTKLSAPVTLKKKGFLSHFIANDFKTIKESVFNNVVVPGIKTFIANVVYGITNATLFKGGPAGPGNYWNYYQQGKTANLGWTPLANNSWSSLKPQTAQQQPSMITGGMVSLDDWKEIRFNSIDDARYIFGLLVQKIVESGKVSVSYMFEKCQLTTLDRTLDNWGWYDLNCGFQITPLNDGKYHLNLPDPVNFNILR